MRKYTRKKMTEEQAIERYKCKASKNGGWCNGSKVGSRMRCPYYGLTKDREGICWLGIEANT